MGYIQLSGEPQEDSSHAENLITSPSDGFEFTAENTRGSSKKKDVTICVRREGQSQLTCHLAFRSIGKGHSHKKVFKDIGPVHGILVRYIENKKTIFTDLLEQPTGHNLDFADIEWDAGQSIYDDYGMGGGD